MKSLKRYHLELNVIIETFTDFAIYFYNHYIMRNKANACACYYFSYRNSCLEVFFEKGFCRNFAKFTENHLSQACKIFKEKF